MGLYNLSEGLLVLEAVDEAGGVLGAAQGGGDLLHMHSICHMHSVYMSYARLINMSYALCTPLDNSITEPFHSHVLFNEIWVQMSKKLAGHHGVFCTCD